MQRAHALDLLKKSKPELIKRFGIRQLALFGSTARDDANARSDVDVLVEFAGIATSARYFGLLFHLEDLLDCRVDLVTEKALRRELRPFVEAEALRV